MVLYKKKIVICVKCAYKPSTTISPTLVLWFIMTVLALYYERLSGVTVFVFFGFNPGPRLSFSWREYAVEYRPEQIQTARNEEHPLPFFRTLYTIQNNDRQCFVFHKSSQIKWVLYALTVACSAFLYGAEGSLSKLIVLQYYSYW